MIFKCGRCCIEETVSFHKDGYEVVAFTCFKCREILINKKQLIIHKTQVRITMQDGDFYYVKKAS